MEKYLDGTNTCCKSKKRAACDRRTDWLFYLTECIVIRPVVSPELYFCVENIFSWGKMVVIVWMLNCELTGVNETMMALLERFTVWMALAIEWTHVCFYCWALIWLVLAQVNILFYQVIQTWPAKSNRWEEFRQHLLVFWLNPEEFLEIFTILKSKSLISLFISFPHHLFSFLVKLCWRFWKCLS